MAPILVILVMATITYGYYTYMIDKTEKEYNESDEDSDDGSEEPDEGTHDKIPRGGPYPRWPHRTPYEKRINVFNFTHLHHRPPDICQNIDSLSLYKYFDISEYRRITRALNPELDLKHILRPASLSITLDNDIIRQIGPTGKNTTTTMRHLSDQYALELEEWARPIHADTPHKLLTMNMTQDQLQAERKWMQMMSRNIREEMLDATRLLFAQEETQADLEANVEEAQQAEEEVDKPQEMDTNVDPWGNDTIHVNHQKEVWETHRRSRRTTHRKRNRKKKAVTTPAEPPDTTSTDYLVMGCRHGADDTGHAHADEGHIDMNWIGAYRASIHEKQAATMKTLALEQKPPQLNQSVRADTARNPTPRIPRRRHAHEVDDHG